MSVQNKPVSKILCLFSKFCHLESMKLMKSNNFTKKKKKGNTWWFLWSPSCWKNLFVSLCFITFFLISIIYLSVCFQRINSTKSISKQTNKQKYIILKSVLWFECRFLYPIIWNMYMLKCLSLFYFILFFILVYLCPRKGEPASWKSY